MAPLEILLLNYLSVLLFTVAFGIFIAGLEKKLLSYSFWYWIAQLLLSLVLYKIIQIYEGFKVIYVADILLLSIFFISKIRSSKPNKQSKVSDLAKVLPRLHKLTTEEFSIYLTKLFKVYGFQSVKQVKIQNDDPDNSSDYYLLARHESSIVEIRIINLTKKLTEKHINEVASNFRDSTSQATSWLLATSAKADHTTNTYLRNSGADIKVFDIKAISDLIYILAPDHKPDASLIKSSSIKMIDYLVHKLSTAKNKLTLDHTSPSSKADVAASKQLLSDVLSENDQSPSLESLDDEKTATKNKTDETDHQATETKPPIIEDAPAAPTVELKEDVQAAPPVETKEETPTALPVEPKVDTTPDSTQEAASTEEQEDDDDVEGETQIPENEITTPTMNEILPEDIPIEDDDPFADEFGSAEETSHTPFFDEDLESLKAAVTSELDLLQGASSTEIDLFLLGVETENSDNNSTTSEEKSNVIPNIQPSESNESVVLNLENEFDLNPIDGSGSLDLQNGIVEGEANASEEPLIPTVSVDILNETVGSESNDSEEPLIPTVSVDLFTKDTPPKFKIDLADLGAALPKQRYMKDNKNT